MTYEVFLEQVISKGIDACCQSYKADPLKRSGAVAGFEACRGKTPEQLKLTLAAASEKREAARWDENKRYWFFRCFEAEVEWVCNVVSAMLYNQGLPVIITPTYRGVIQAAAIVGVAHQPKEQ